MNKSTLTALTTLVVVTTVALAASTVSAREVDETLDAHSNSLVKIFNTSGEVEIEAWSRNSVEVTGTLGEDVEELVFKRDGQEIVIKVKMPSGKRGRLDASADLSIHVPENSSVEVSTVSADVDTRGVQGEQELASVSGDIFAEVFGGDIAVESVSGDIDIEGDAKDADAQFASVSGDIDTERLAGIIGIETTTGDITIDSGSFGNARIETVNGDIVHRAVLRDGGRLNVDTVNGDVDIEFEGQFSAKIDIDTFNGGINNCFGPKPTRKDRYAPGLELTFTEGDGDGRVRVETLNGDIRICKD